MENRTSSRDTASACARPLAMVTGASSGIGATYARRLAAAGYDLVLVARRKDKLEALAAEVEASHGIRAEVLCADLAAGAGLELAARRVAAAQNLEFLVNNAGFGTRGFFHEAELEGQERMHRLHVLATMRLTHAALPEMVARGRGSIVNVASVAGFSVAPGNISYGSTKCWINAFTEGIYLELKIARSPVRVQSLCPGFTYTEFHDVLGVDRKLIPAFLWMRAEDIVEASLQGLERGRLFVVPGWRYKLIVVLLQLLPRWVLHPLVIRYAQRTKRY